jgi:hypothetical protein
MAHLSRKCTSIAFSAGSVRQSECGLFRMDRTNLEPIFNIHGIASRSHTDIYESTVIDNHLGRILEFAIFRDPHQPSPQYRGIRVSFTSPPRDWETTWTDICCSHGKA